MFVKFLETGLVERNDEISSKQGVLDSAEKNRPSIDSATCGKGSKNESIAQIFSANEL